MKLFIYFILAIGSIKHGVAQKNKMAIKSLIDTAEFSGWPYVDGAGLSPNGRFAFFNIHEQPKYSTTLVVVNTYTKQRFSVIDANSYDALFTADSKQLIFKKADTLIQLWLDSFKTTCHPDVSSFKLSDYSNDQQLAFLLKGKEQRLRVLRLHNNRHFDIDSICSFWFLNDSSSLLLEKSHTNGGYAIEMLNMNTFESRTLNQGEGRINDIKFANDYSRFVFTIDNKGEVSSDIGIYCYDLVKNEKMKISFPKDISNEYGHLFINKFSNDNKKVFISLIKRQASIKKIIVKPALDVWSYHDKFLQAKQALETNGQVQAVLDMTNGNIRILENEGQQVIENYQGDSFRDQYKLVYERQAASDEVRWNKWSTVKMYIKSTTDDYEIQLNKNRRIEIVTSYTFSPDNKYVLFYDPPSKNFYSYCVASKTYSNITHDVKVKWTISNDEPISGAAAIGVACFFNQSSNALIYASHDIYQVDLTGKNSPICLTNLQGVRKNIVFRLAMNHMDHPLTTKVDLILNAFDNISKKNGFYQLSLRGNHPILTELSMSNNIYVGPYDSPEINVMAPIKASGSNCYIVRKMDSWHSPNFFFTTDFKVFTPLSNVHPESSYIWMRSELINYTTAEGKKLQGILYKPENFKSNIKYPLIVNCYERFSSGLNGYITPSGSSGALNIPYFVSHGYLVFNPDILYTMGKPGESACQAITSALKVLAKNRWFDKDKVGIQGHSFGGFETLYIVSHTNKFSAAIASAGVSNFISAFGSLKGNGESRQGIYEMTQSRMGFSPWEKLAEYLENSSVLSANRINTPLLLINNKNDAQVPFSQGIEMFTSMRRLNKTSWLLQYDGEGHLVLDDKNQIDLAVRMKQYFDHYLNHAPAPKWMTEGIAANEKGQTLKYELDFKNACSRKCKICQEKRLPFAKSLVE